MGRTQVIPFQSRIPEVKTLQLNRVKECTSKTFTPRNVHAITNVRHMQPIHEPVEAQTCSAFTEVAVWRDLVTALTTSATKYRRLSPPVAKTKRIHPEHQPDWILKSDKPFVRAPRERRTAGSLDGRSAPSVTAAGGNGGSRRRRKTTAGWCNGAQCPGIPMFLLTLTNLALEQRIPNRLCNTPAQDDTGEALSTHISHNSTPSFSPQ